METRRMTQEWQVSNLPTLPGDTKIQCKDADEVALVLQELGNNDSTVTRTIITTITHIEEFTAVEFLGAPLEER